MAKQARSAKGKGGGRVSLTPMKAIRAKCLDCMCDSAQEVKLCPIVNCPLYEFRLGHNPNIKPREMTEEQKQALRERLAKSREGKR